MVYAPRPTMNDSDKLAGAPARLLSVGPRQIGFPSGRTTKVSDFEQTRPETVGIVPTTSAAPRIDLSPSVGGFAFNQPRGQCWGHFFRAQKLVLAARGGA
jgi:hypothetical protein